MGVLKINYQAAIDLGFKRIDSPDQVWFDENGYDYFIVEKRIAPDGILYWNPKDHQVEFCVLNKDHSTKVRRTVGTYDELESLSLLGQYYQEEE
jgi:hypothetical protein